MVSSDTAASNVRDLEPQEALIQVSGVVKRFDGHVVVNAVTMACSPGDVVLLLGANGAGKSTLLRILAGLTRPDLGRVHLRGDLRVGYAGHHTCLYSKLSVAENLSLYAKLAGRSDKYLNQLMHRWRLEDVQHKAVADVSRGAQSKASLVRALVAEPALLVLDEPSSNLDEGATGVLRDVIAETTGRGGGVILATHDLARLSEVATRVVVMASGALIADSGVGRRERSLIESVIERYRASNR